LATLAYPDMIRSIIQTGSARIDILIKNLPEFPDQETSFPVFLRYKYDRSEVKTLQEIQHTGLNLQENHLFNWNLAVRHFISQR
jgi:hypothetical protein